MIRSKSAITPVQLFEMIVTGCLPNEKRRMNFRALIGIKGVWVRLDKSVIKTSIQCAKSQSNVMCFTVLGASRISLRKLI